MSAAQMNSALQGLSAVADDRIRDVARATVLLQELLQGLHEAFHEGVPIPWQTILLRLCYFANARDGAVRVFTYRVLLCVCSTRPALMFLTRTRLSLSLTRSLDREPQYVWERASALVLVRRIVMHCPDCLPVSALRSLIALVVEGPQVEPAVSRGAGAATGAAGAANTPFRANGRPQGAVNVSAAPVGVAGQPNNPAGRAVDAVGGGGGGANSWSSDAGASAGLMGVTAEAIRRGAIAVLCHAALCPRTLPLLASVGGLLTLLDTAVSACGPITGVADGDMLPRLLAVLAKTWASPAARPFLPVGTVFDTILSVFTAHMLVSSGVKDAHAGKGKGQGGHADGKGVNRVDRSAPAPAITRARWAGARHLFVSLCRTRSGLLSVATDVHALPSLMAALASKDCPHDLTLCLLRLFLELLCPPLCADTEGIPCLGPFPRNMSHPFMPAYARPATDASTGPGGETSQFPASARDVDTGPAGVALFTFTSERARLDRRAADQALALAYTASSQATHAACARLAERRGLGRSVRAACAGAAAMTVCGYEDCQKVKPGTMKPASNLYRERVLSGSFLTGATPAQLLRLSQDTCLPLDMLLEVGAVSVAGKASSGVGMSTGGAFAESAVLLASSASADMDMGRTVPNAEFTARCSGALAPPVYSSEARHELAQTPECYGSFWACVDAAAVTLCDRTPVSVRATAGSRASMHCDSQPWKTGPLVLAAADTVDSYRCQVLHILLHAGLLPALCTALTCPNALVHTAARALIRYVTALSLRILPSSAPWAGPWIGQMDSASASVCLPVPGMQELFQAAAAAGCAMPYPIANVKSSSWLQSSLSSTRGGVLQDPIALMRAVRSSAFQWPPIQTVRLPSGLPPPSLTLVSPADAARRRVLLHTLICAYQYGWPHPESEHVVEVNSGLVYRPSLFTGALDEVIGAGLYLTKNADGDGVGQQLGDIEYMPASTQGMSMSKHAAAWNCASAVRKRVLQVEILSLNGLLDKATAFEFANISKIDQGRIDRHEAASFTTQRTLASYGVVFDRSAIGQVNFVGASPHILHGACDLHQRVLPTAYGSPGLVLDCSIDTTSVANSPVALLLNVQQLQDLVGMPTSSSVLHVGRNAIFSSPSGPRPTVQGPARYGVHVAEGTCGHPEIRVPLLALMPGPGVGLTLATFRLGDVVKDVHALLRLSLESGHRNGSTGCVGDDPYSDILAPLLDVLCRMSLASRDHKQGPASSRRRRGRRASTSTAAEQLRDPLASARSILAGFEDGKGLWAACTLLDGLGGTSGVSPPLPDTSPARASSLMHFYEAAAGVAVHASIKSGASSMSTDAPATATVPQAQPVADSKIVDSYSGVPVPKQAGTGGYTPSVSELQQALLRSTGSNSGVISKAGSDVLISVEEWGGKGKKDSKREKERSESGKEKVNNRAKDVERDDESEKEKNEADKTREKGKDKIEKEKKTESSKDSSRKEKKNDEKRTAKETLALDEAVSRDVAPAMATANVSEPASVKPPKPAESKPALPSTSRTRERKLDISLADPAMASGSAITASANGISTGTISSASVPLASLLAVKPSGELEARLRTFLNAAGGGSTPVFDAAGRRIRPNSLKLAQGSSTPGMGSPLVGQVAAEAVGIVSDTTNPAPMQAVPHDPPHPLPSRGSINAPSSPSADGPATEVSKDGAGSASPLPASAVQNPPASGNAVPPPTAPPFLPPTSNTAGKPAAKPSTPFNEFGAGSNDARRTPARGLLASLADRALSSSSIRKVTPLPNIIGTPVATALYLDGKSGTEEMLVSSLPPRSSVQLVSKTDPVPVQGTMTDEAETVAPSIAVTSSGQSSPVRPPASGRQRMRGISTETDSSIAPSSLLSPRKSSLSLLRRRDNRVHPVAQPPPHPETIAPITHVREDDRAVAWQILRARNGGTWALLHGLESRHAPPNVVVALQRVWRACVSLPTHVAWLNDPCTGVPALPSAVCPALDMVPYGREGASNAHPLPIRGRGSGGRFANPSFTSLASIIAGQGIRQSYLGPLAFSSGGPWSPGVGQGGAGSGTQSSVSGGGIVLGGAASGTSSTGGAQDGTAALSAACFQAITATRVLSSRDWRFWDWGCVALIMDSYLVHSQVLADVLGRTSYLEKLGEVVARAGPEALSALPWTPASLRFVHVAKAWLLIASHSPHARPLLTITPNTFGNRPRRDSMWGASSVQDKPMPTDAAPAGLLLELALALMARLSVPVLQALRAASRPFPAERDASTTHSPSTPAPPASMVAALSAMLGSSTSMSRSKRSIGSAEEGAIGGDVLGSGAQPAAIIRALVAQGSIAHPESIASALSPTAFVSTCARELLSLWATLAATGEGNALLKLLDPLCAILMGSGYGFTSHTMLQEFALLVDAPEPMRSLLAPTSLSMLVHLGAADRPGCSHLARHLLCKLDCSQPGVARHVLAAWTLGWAPPSIRLATSPSLLPTPFLANCSVSLFATHWLRACLRQASGAAPGWSNWAVHILVAQLHVASAVSAKARVHPCPVFVHDVKCAANVADAALDALIEAAARSRLYACAIIAALALKPSALLDQFTRGEAAPLIELLVGEPSGFFLCRSRGWITLLLHAWMGRGSSKAGQPLFVEWAAAADRALSAGLSHSVGIVDSYSNGSYFAQTDAPSNVLQYVSPAVLPETRGGLSADRLARTILPTVLGCKGPVPLPLHVPQMAPPCASDGQSAAVGAQTGHAPSCARLDLLLQLPWRVAVQAEWEGEGVLQGPGAGVAGMYGPASASAPAQPVGSMGASGSASDMQGVWHGQGAAVGGGGGGGGTMLTTDPSGGGGAVPPSQASWPSTPTSGIQGHLHSGSDAVPAFGASQPAMPRGRAVVTVPMAVETVVHLVKPSNAAAVMPSLFNARLHSGVAGLNKQRSDECDCGVGSSAYGSWSHLTDGFIRATCVDSDGCPCPAPLRSSSQVHTALLCGAHAVGPRGGVPFAASITEPVSVAGAGARGGVGVYARVGDILAAWAVQEGTETGRRGRSSGMDTRSSALAAARGGEGEGQARSRSFAAPSASVSSSSRRGTDGPKASDVGGGSSSMRRGSEAPARPGRSRSFGGSAWAQAEEAGSTGTGGATDDESSDSGSSVGSSLPSRGAAKSNAGSHPAGVDPGLASPAGPPSYPSAPPPTSALEATTTALSARVAQAVADIAVPLNRRTTVAWVADVGAVDLGQTGMVGSGDTSKAGTNRTVSARGTGAAGRVQVQAGPLDDLSSAGRALLPRALAAQFNLSTDSQGTRLPDSLSSPAAVLLAHSPEGPPIIAAHSLAAVATSLRANAREQCLWQTCDASVTSLSLFSTSEAALLGEVDGVRVEVGRRGSMLPDERLREVAKKGKMKKQAPELDTAPPDPKPCLRCGAGIPGSPTRVITTPPGSTARFTFLVSRAQVMKEGVEEEAGDEKEMVQAEATVALESVDFPFSLLPRSVPGPSLSPEPGEDGPLLPMHLLAQCARHRAGAGCLAATGILRDLLAAAFEGETADILICRAAIWSLGAIGASPFGYGALLEAEPLLPIRIDAAARGLRLRVWKEGGNVRMLAVPDLRDDISLRFPASAALALFSRHPAGLSCVHTLGWRVHAGAALVATPVSPPTAYTLLPRPSAAVSATEGDWDVAACDVLHSFGQGLPPSPGEPPRLSAAVWRTDDTDTIGPLEGAASQVACMPYLARSNLPAVKPEWENILARLTELANRVTSRDARSALSKAKADRPDLFASSALYAHAHALMAALPMSLTTRRIVHALFERVSFSDKAFEGVGPLVGPPVRSLP